MGSKFESVDDYVRRLGAPAGATVRAVLDAVVSGYDGLAVKLAWNVPQIHLGTGYVMGVSAAKHHISVSPWSKEVMVGFAARLVDYAPTDNLFRVPLDWKVDRRWLRDLAGARLAELGR